LTNVYYIHKKGTCIEISESNTDYMNTIFFFKKYMYQKVICSEMLVTTTEFQDINTETIKNTQKRDQQRNISNNHWLPECKHKTYTKNIHKKETCRKISATIADFQKKFKSQKAYTKTKKYLQKESYSKISATIADFQNRNTKPQKHALKPKNIHTKRPAAKYQQQLLTSKI